MNISNSFSLNAGGSNQKSPMSALDQVLLIKEIDASPEEKRKMLQALQMKMEGERIQELMVSMKKVEAKEENKEEEQSNADGDTVEISQEAQLQFAQSDNEASPSQNVESSVNSNESSQVY